MNNLKEHYNNFDNIGSQEGKICIITGSNSGIGKSAAFEFAKRKATVVMACRNKERSQKALEEIREKTNNKNIKLMVIDLSSQKSIRNFVKGFRTKFDKLHILINNAANFDLCLKRPVMT